MVRKMVETYQDNRHNCTKTEPSQRARSIALKIYLPCSHSTINCVGDQLVDHRICPWALIRRFKKELINPPFDPWTMRVKYIAKCSRDDDVRKCSADALNRSSHLGYLSDSVEKENEGRTTSSHACIARMEYCLLVALKMPISWEYGNGVATHIIVTRPILRQRTA